MTSVLTKPTITHLSYIIITPSIIIKHGIEPVNYIFKVKSDSSPTTNIVSIATLWTNALLSDFIWLIRNIIFSLSPCISASTVLLCLFLTQPVKFRRFANSYISNLNFIFCTLPENIMLFLTIGDALKIGSFTRLTWLITYPSINLLK